MAPYRAQHLTHGDDIFSVDHFVAEHDRAAIEHAAKKLRSGIGKGYEIWQNDRLVHVERYRRR